MKTTIAMKQPSSVELVPWSEQSDEDLLSAYRDRGIRQAFTELVRRYERELYSYLCRYLNDGTLAEDAFQATFLQVHLKCSQFEMGRKVRPWLYTIATHQAIDAQRRNKRHRMLSLDRHNAQEDDGDLVTLLDLLLQGKIRPIIAQRFPLAEARRAQESLENGGVIGKGVLIPAA